MIRMGGDVDIISVRDEIQSHRFVIVVSKTHRQNFAYNHNSVLYHVYIGGSGYRRLAKTTKLTIRIIPPPIHQ